MDLKTSKGIFNEMRIQLSAYEQLNNESGAKPIDRCILVRIGKKETMDFQAEEIYDRKPYFTAFLAALNLYRALQAIK